MCKFPQSLANDRQELGIVRGLLQIGRRSGFDGALSVHRQKQGSRILAQTGT